MITADKIRHYCTEVEQDLQQNILPFWLNHVVDHDNGGFYGYLSNDLKVDRKAPKGCILNSRILWTYSFAYRIYHDPRFLSAATRAFDYLIHHFWDQKYSGLYWMVDYQGEAINTRKQIYNLAFGIYGLSEFYRATGNMDSLAKAVELFKFIEAKSYDRINKGYIEALSREWLPIDDYRLSENDLNEKKSMNTHLHILEAYTNLLRVWSDDELRKQLKEIIDVTIEHIIDPQTFHLKMFFNDQWRSANRVISFGHDIEGSWLLYESAKVLNEKTVLDKVKRIVIEMAQRVYDEGVDRGHGGLFYESDSGLLVEDKQWWPQAEAMVGFLNAYELSGKEHFFEASYNTWQFVKQYMIDHQKGEWFLKVACNGEVYENLPKVDPWKCPYHNSRACFEVLQRLANYERIAAEVS